MTLLKFSPPARALRKRSPMHTSLILNPLPFSTRESWVWQPPCNMPGQIGSQAIERLGTKPPRRDPNVNPEEVTDHEPERYQEGPRSHQFQKCGLHQCGHQEHGQ